MERTPVSSVMLAVPDASSAARWYAEALGATPAAVHRQGGFVDPFGHLWLVGDRPPLGEASWRATTS